MDLSLRQRAALDILLRGGGKELSLRKIATSIGVSGKTVHRELARIAPSLRQTYGLAFEGKAGQGFRVVGSPERVQDCLNDLERTKENEIGADERRRLLTILLIEADEPVKLFTLEVELGLGAVTVRRDIESLRPWLESNGLFLKLKRGVGVVLNGTEGARRQALTALVLEEFGETGILDLLSRKPEAVGLLDLPRKRFLEIARTDDLAMAEDVLSRLGNSGSLSIAPHDYLGLIVQLAVAVGRNRAGKRLGGAEPAERAAEEGDQAGLILSAMAKISGLPFDKREAQALRSYLLGAKLESADGIKLEELDLEEFSALRSFVKRCGELYGAPFQDDPVLRDGLVAHWGPALYRLKNRIPIHAPLLGQIRSNYERLFDTVREAIDEAFPRLGVPDDEVAYLVLHFGSSLERGAMPPRRFRALVVCSAGIGSAQMLASRIRAELPELEIVASLSWFDVAKIDRDEWDVLVSTIPLPLAPDEYLLVNPLLPPEGITAFRAFLLRRGGRIRAVASKGGETTNEDLAGLRAMNSHLSAAVGILENFSVFAVDVRSSAERHSWKNFLAAVIGNCGKEGLITDREAALADLERRSVDGGILLPGSSILFLHARSRGVSRPSLSLHLMKNPPEAPVAWPRKPTRLVLMLAPEALDRAVQDVLNEISSSFLEEGTIQALATGDEAAIRIHYTRRLDRYIRAVPNQGVSSS